MLLPTSIDRVEVDFVASVYEALCYRDTLSFALYFTAYLGI